MLGPPICINCKVCYDSFYYTNEEGDNCVKWYCPKCKAEDSKDYAFTISKQLFDEIFPEPEEKCYCPCGSYEECNCFLPWNEEDEQEESK